MITPPLDAGSTLTHLIDFAQRALMRGARPDASFDEIAAAIAMPGASLSGIGDEARMLVQALRHLDGAEDGPMAWRMIAGALLPMVQANAWRLIEQRRIDAGKPDPEAQPNYRGRRP